MRVIFKNKIRNFVEYEDTKIGSVVRVGDKWVIKYNDKADYGIITGIELDAEMFELWKIVEE